MAASIMVKKIQMQVPTLELTFSNPKSRLQKIWIEMHSPCVEFVEASFNACPTKHMNFVG